MLGSEEACGEAIGITGLEHRIYLPQSLRLRDDCPLILLVHGRNGNSKMMWTFSGMLPEGKAVCIAPQGFVSDIEGGWSWWPGYNKDLLSEEEKIKAKRLSHEGVLRAVEVLKNFIEGAKLYYQIEPRLVIGIGFSQGAAVLSSLTLLNPGYIKGLALLAGFVPGSIRKQTFCGQDIKVADGLSLFVAHGANDTIVPLKEAEQGVRLFSDCGAEVEFIHEPVGHKVGVSGQKAMREWLKGMILKCPVAEGGSR